MDHRVIKTVQGEAIYEGLVVTLDRGVLKASLWAMRTKEGQKQ